VGEAAVVGDKRRFPSVLLVPNFPVLEEWAREHSVPANSRKELVRSSQVHAIYQGVVDEVRRNLAQYEKLNKLMILTEDLSIADGTLSPIMKLQRRHL